VILKPSGTRFYGIPIGARQHNSDHAPVRWVHEFRAIRQLKRYEVLKFMCLSPLDHVRLRIFCLHDDIAEFVTAPGSTGYLDD
jgi:hypothetical protein